MPIIVGEPFDRPCVFVKECIYERKYKESQRIPSHFLLTITITVIRIIYLFLRMHLILTRGL